MNRIPGDARVELVAPDGETLPKRNFSKLESIEVPKSTYVYGAGEEHPL
jgi:hypothetical protein